jgi:hypothetical protein
MIQGNGRINAVDWSPNGLRLAYGGADGTLQIVNVGCTVTVPDGSLSEMFIAIEDANQTGVPTTVCLAPGGTYTLTSGFADFFGPTGIPPVTGNVTIVGDGATIQRDPAAFAYFRIFGVEDPGVLTLENLTLQNGLIDQNAGGAIVNVGGTVNLNGVNLLNNEAASPTDSQGGAIFNYFGTLNASNSRILNNRAAVGAAAIFNVGGTVTISDSCIVNNYAPDALAVTNAEAEDIHAVNNWWGAADGPSGNGPGSGDGVSVGVLFDPFLTVAPADCPASSPPPTPTPTDIPTPTATPPPTSPLSSFAVLGQEGIWLEQNSTLVSGDVAANVASSGPFLAEGSEATIGIGVQFLDPASAVFGDSVYVRQGAQVYDVYYNTLGGQGQILGQPFTPLALPVVPAFPTVPTFTPGTQNLNVPPNGSLTLDAGSYGTLTAGQGATMVFTGGIYDFQEWDLGMDVNVSFAAPAEIRVAGRLQVGQGSSVGPATGSNLAATDIILYVTGQNGSSGNLGATPKAAHFGINNTLIANVYAPNGTLWIRQGSTARGAFVGRWVDIGIGVEVTLESAF